MTALGHAPTSRGRSRASFAGQRGVTLVELLVALAMGTLCVSVLALLSSGVLTAFDADTAAADQQQRARGGIVALIDDLTRAGSGFVAGIEAAPGWGVPAVFPDRPRANAWAASAAPNIVTTLSGRRSEAHATLALPAPMGSARLTLERPRYCGPADCGFSAGDDVAIFDDHGRVALAAVRAVSSSLVMDLAAPLGESWRAGARVSAVAATTYATRADSATGLLQLTRARGDGPATTLLDFVTSFDVEWALNGAPPTVYFAPDGTEEGTTEGPVPPFAGVLAGDSWPAGENCVFTRDATGTSAPRLGTLGSGVVRVPVETLSDGPWCPSPSAPTRWDADLIRVAEIRVTLRLAVASAYLRAPMETLLGGATRQSTRRVQDLFVTATIRRGHRGQGR